MAFIALLSGTLGSVGCTYTVTSDPPGATVYGYYMIGNQGYWEKISTTPLTWNDFSNYYFSYYAVWPDGVRTPITPSARRVHLQKSGLVRYERGRPSLYDNSALQRVAVLSFGNEEFADEIAAALVNHSRWNVYDRDNLKKILDEQDLQSLAQFDQATAAKIGKLAGVQMVIFGSYSDRRASIKAVDVQTGKYVAYQTVSMPSQEIKFNARFVLRFLLPYSIRYEMGQPSFIWVGENADKLSDEKLQRLVTEARSK